MDEGQGRGIPAAHAGVRLSDRLQTPSRRRRVEGCSQSQGEVRSQNAGESSSSLSCKEHQHVDGAGYGWVGGPDGSRTRDLMNAIHARSQLRYWPTLPPVNHLLYPIPNTAPWVCLRPVASA